MLRHRIHLLLAACVAVWWSCSTFLPQAVGSCLSTTCDPAPARVAISVLIPFVMASFPVLVEVVVYRQSWSGALRAIGITRWHRGGLGVALLYLLPLFAFFPVFAAATGQTLLLQSNWLGLTAGAVLNNGLNEEAMMRGFVFRRLREDRPFWRAAALSTAYFAAYHVPLIAMSGPLIGSISVIIAIPTGMLTAYIYERGDRTIWGNALVHTGTNAPAFLFSVAGTLQPIATMLYLFTSIAVSSAIVIVAYRKRRDEARTDR